MKTTRHEITFLGTSIGSSDGRLQQHGSREIGNIFHRKPIYVMLGNSIGTIDSLPKLT